MSLFRQAFNRSDVDAGKSFDSSQSSDGSPHFASSKGASSPPRQGYLVQRDCLQRLASCGVEIGVMRTESPISCFPFGMESNDVRRKPRVGMTHSRGLRNNLGNLDIRSFHFILTQSKALDDSFPMKYESMRNSQRVLSYNELKSQVGNRPKFIVLTHSRPCFAVL